MILQVSNWQSKKLSGVLRKVAVLRYMTTALFVQKIKAGCEESTKTTMKACKDNIGAQYIQSIEKNGQCTYARQHLSDQVL